jgi:hypothetical protein
VDGTSRGFFLGKFRAHHLRFPEDLILKSERYALSFLTLLDFETSDIDNLSWLYYAMFSDNS